jgi:PKHD-type hydroxylase
MNRIIGITFGKGNNMPVFTFAPPPDLCTNEQTFATWNDAFSDAEISEIRKLGDKLALNDAIVNVADLNTEIRKAKVGWLEFTTETGWLYERLAFVGRQLNGKFYDFDLHGFVEPMQYTVYTSENAHYSWHMDKGNLNSAPRKLSMVIQLSDPTEYEGGDLELMTGADNVSTVERKKGLIVSFPSWIMHRVTPVTAGTRKSLVCWVAGNKFK